MFVAQQSQAMMCGHDIIISITIETQTQPCVTGGYCTMYDFNPETGEYENFYGYHHNCEGTQEKRDEKYTCQREDFSTYEDVTEGFWGFCSVTGF